MYSPSLFNRKILSSKTNDINDGGLPDREHDHGRVLRG